MTAPEPTAGTRARAPAWRRGLRWALILAVQGAVLWYIGRTILRHQQALLDLPILHPGFLAVMTAVALAYAFSLALPAWGWTALVAGFGGHAAPLRSGLWIYGQTLTAKYLPGNVLHYVGRHWLGKRLGWSQAGIGLAALVEAMVAVSAGAMLALATSFWMRLPLAGPIPAGAYLSLAVAGAALPFAFVRLGQWAPVGRLLARLSIRVVPLRMAALLLSQAAFLAFLLLSAAMLWWVAAVLVQSLEVRHLQAALAAYGVIYVVGFVLPGAPGGLGVREALTILMLGPFLGESVAAAAAIAFRLATMAGEVLFFLGTWKLGPRSPEV